MNRSTAGAALAVLVVLSGIGATPPGVAATDDAAQDAAAAVALAHEAALGDLVAKAESLGAVGLFLDDTGGYVLRVPTAVAAQFQLTEPPRIQEPVRVATSDLDRVTISKIKDRLAGLFADLRANGATDVRYAYFYDARLDRIVVDTNVTEDLVSSAVGDLGAPITYLKGGPVPFSNRWNDNPAFWSGGPSNDAPGSYCTVGFEVHSSSGPGYNLMSAAGHCEVTTTTVYAGSGTQGGALGLTLGAQANRHCAGGYDAAWISGQTYAPQVWTGGIYGTTHTTTKGWVAGQIGATYYYSGAKTGEHLTVVVANSATIDWGCGTSATTMVIQNSPNDGLCAGRPGDSGAPYYLKSGTYDYAVGLIVAGNSLTNPTYCYAEHWGRVLTSLNVTLVTG